MDQSTRVSEGPQSSQGGLKNSSRIGSIETSALNWRNKLDIAPKLAGPHTAPARGVEALQHLVMLACPR